MILKYLLKNVLFFAVIAIAFITLINLNMNKLVNTIAPQAVQFEAVTGEPLMQET